MSAPVLSYVVKRLGDLLIDKVVSLYNLHDEIQLLLQELDGMVAFLEDADSWYSMNKSEEKLVEQIREVAYQAEDALENFIIKRRPGRRRVPFLPFIKRYALFQPCRDRNNLDAKVKYIWKQITKIKERKSTYVTPNPRESHEERLRERTVYNGHSSIVGFLKEKERLLKMLCSEEESLLTISIFGMGGLGKTTLARQVFDHLKKVGKFKYPAWVDAYKGCKDTEILKRFVKAVIGLSSDDLKNTGKEELQEQIRHFLSGKNYIIFVDDVWAENTWSTIEQCLPRERSGSRVLITTRCLPVACQCELFEMKCLEKGDSLELLQRTCRPNGDVTEDLRRTCHSIIDKCCGLPLAIVVLGGLLRHKAVSEWPGIVKFDGNQVKGFHWNADEVGQRCLEILALSYNDLEYEMKLCFLYFSAFPASHEIHVKTLIRLWIAEGFMTCLHESTFAETAYRYLEKLRDRCLIQVSGKNHDGVMKACKMHDMILELSILKARKNHFFDIFIGDDESPLKKVRRLALHKCISDKYGYKEETRYIRTLLYFGSSRIKYEFEDLKFLRVLDLADSGITELSNKIGEMIHLRYLGLARTRLNSLPSSIVCLVNLQSLDIRGTSIRDLPRYAWKYLTLTYIYATCLNMPKKENQIKDECLKKISIFQGVTVGLWMGRKLQMMADLCVLSVEGAQLSFDAYGCDKLPPKLVEINLKGTILGDKVWEMLEKLLSLKILRLAETSFSIERNIEFNARNFPSLEILSLTKVKNIRKLVRTGSAMCHLKYLYIVDCAQLELPLSGFRNAEGPEIKLDGEDTSL